MWHITVDYADDRPRREMDMPIHSAPAAVESALRKMGMGDEHYGSFQITVTDEHTLRRGRLPDAPV